MRAARRFALAVALLSSLACRPPEEECLEPLSLGGDFALTGTDGRPFRLSSLRGRVVLLFFGYTACPDVCPTTIARLSRAMNLLKKERPKAAVSIVFVSVDAERDTPERLRDYLAYFALPVQGATGTEAEVAPVLRTFGASFEKVPIQSALKYRIDHTAYVYLIDPLGRTVHLFGHSDPPEEIARLVSRVLAGHTCGGTPTAAGTPALPSPGAKGVSRPAPLPGGIALGGGPWSDRPLRFSSFCFRSSARAARRPGRPAPRSTPGTKTGVG